MGMDYWALLWLSLWPPSPFSSQHFSSILSLFSAFLYPFTFFNLLLSFQPPSLSSFQPSSSPFPSFQQLLLYHFLLLNPSSSPFSSTQTFLALFFPLTVFFVTIFFHSTLHLCSFLSASTFSSTLSSHSTLLVLSFLLFILLLSLFAPCMGPSLLR